MAVESRVQKLLDEIADSGRTPEQVCVACLELLPEVRHRWQRMRILEAELDALFPTPGPDLDADIHIPQHAGGDLPQVPGYNVEAELGHGGMGVVYRAWHLRLHRRVALKMLLAGRHARPAERERFVREAQAVAGLRHPNIVQVYEAGDVDGQSYFTMELVEGGSLAQQIQGIPQPVRNAAVLVATLADAVHAAHESGIVHRDLKPGNVLLTADGTPKVTDFGLARHLQDGGELTLSGAPVGTPSYMAPEQAQGRKDAIGPATDVYALGATLYELLTGRPPFRAETATATLQQVLADEPVPPARLNPQVPRDLQTVCLKCLEKDPARRFASAAALADDLRRFERGEPIVAQPVGRLERAAKWARRRPAAAVLLATGVLMFAGVTAAAVWYAGDRARLHYEEQFRAAEVQNRSREVNREANHALDQAELHLKDLHARMDDPLRVHELLSDIDHWQSIVEQARQASQRARSAYVGNEELVADQTRARIKAVLAKLSSEDASYRLAMDLDDIHAEAFTPTDDRQSRVGRVTARYANFFSRLGMDVDRAGKIHLESALTSSPVRFALVAGLDNWADLTAAVNARDPRLARLLELARAADPDPWRDRFRDPAVWSDRTALTALAGDVDVERQSPTILTSFGLRLQLTGADSMALYKKAILYHPRDFWLHLNAGSYAKESGVRVGLNLAACAIRPNSPMAYSNLSNSLREQGDLSGALTAANRALAINPRFVPAHVNLGSALAQSKDLHGAVAASKKAIEFDPKRTEAYVILGWALRESKDLQGAIAASRKAIELDPNYKAAHNSLGVALLENKDLPGAVTAFKKAIELDPKYASAHGYLGAALLLQQDPAGAVAALKKATELDPKSATNHNILGLALRVSKDLPGAVAACKKGVELEPNSAPAYLSLGLVLLESKDLPGAAAAFKKAAELDPKSASAHSNLGSALRESKDLPGAVAACKKAIELDPKCTAAYVNLAVALRESNDLPGAVAAFKKVTELDPRFTAAHNDLGHALRESKDLPGAVAAFKKAIELDPGRFQAHYGLGMTHRSQGRYAEAERAYLGAIKAQPAFAPAYNGLAWLLATCPDDKVRDGKRAVEYATTACKLTGWKEPGYLDTLAAAYAEAGQFEEAIRDQTRALGDPTFKARFGPAARQRLKLYQQQKPFRDQ
jgi:eukaryotic-like serine/threonine-protein kinase